MQHAVTSEFETFAARTTIAKERRKVRNFSKVKCDKVAEKSFAITASISITRILTPSHRNGPTTQGRLPELEGTCTTRMETTVFRKWIWLNETICRKLLAQFCFIGKSRLEHLGLRFHIDSSEHGTTTHRSILETRTLYADDMKVHTSRQAHESLTCS